MTKQQIVSIALKIYEIQEFAFITQQSREDSFSELVKLIYDELGGQQFSFFELSEFAGDEYRKKYAVSKIDKKQFFIDQIGNC